MECEALTIFTDLIFCWVAHTLWPSYLFKHCRIKKCVHVLCLKKTFGRLFQGQHLERGQHLLKGQGQKILAGLWTKVSRSRSIHEGPRFFYSYHPPFYINIVCKHDSYKEDFFCDYFLSVVRRPCVIRSIIKCNA